MANRRMLSRRVSQSKKVNTLSLKSQIIWTWMFPFLDDYGCYTSDSEDIKTEVFPKNKRISIRDIARSLKELHSAGLIHTYKVDDKPYLQYVKFEDFQTFRADRTRQSEYPKYNGIPLATSDIPKLSKDKISKDKYGEFALLTPTQYGNLIETYGKSIINQYIEKLNNYIGSKGRKYKSHYHTLLTWISKDNIKKIPPKKHKPTGEPLKRFDAAGLIRKTVEKMK